MLNLTALFLKIPLFSVRNIITLKVIDARRRKLPLLITIRVFKF